MSGENINLTSAEWNVMECLWTKSPQTAMRLVAQLQRQVGWAKSTTMTMLTRMEKKGLLLCTGSEKPRHYTPAVRREDAVRQETKSFVRRVFRGSVGMMMSSLVEQQELTKEEIDQLYAVLKKAEEAER